MSSPRDFGAAGDGQTDDTAAIQHAVEQGDGFLEFPPGDYVLTRSIVVELDRTGRLGLAGSGGTAKIIMAGPGPAFHLLGTHDQTAQPVDFQPVVWQRQRMPTLLNIEIEGRHPEADGVWVEGTMQTTFEGVLLRQLQHGIRAHRRARNVIVSHCHIYDNRGVGVFFDEVNLHQANIVGSHISYCQAGGIKIRGSEVRNLQITGNDIEYNFDLAAPASADIWIDSSADGATVREGTIAGNTIQAVASPGGANVRIIGHNPEENHKAGLLAITGNLIGSQEVNVHLLACRGVTMVGNVLYSGHHRNLLVEGSRNIVIGPNSFDHNPDYHARELCTGVRLADSRDLTLTGLLIHDCQTGQHTVEGVTPIQRDGLVEIVNCQRVNVSGCHVLDGYPHGIFVADSSHVSITGSTVLETRTEKKTIASLRWQGTGGGSYLAGNILGRGTEAAHLIDPAAGISLGENLVCED